MKEVTKQVRNQGFSYCFAGVWKDPDPYLRLMDPEVPKTYGFYELDLDADPDPQHSCVGLKASSTFMGMLI
jgi:hypothetical protein